MNSCVVRDCRIRSNTSPVRRKLRDQRKVLGSQRATFVWPLVGTVVAQSPLTPIEELSRLIFFDENLVSQQPVLRCPPHPGNRRNPRQCPRRILRIDPGELATQPPSAAMPRKSPSCPWIAGAPWRQLLGWPGNRRNTWQPSRRAGQRPVPKSRRAGPSKCQ
jgi:hypothetical protein